MCTRMFRENMVVVRSCSKFKFSGNITFIVQLFNLVLSQDVVIISRCGFRLFDFFGIFCDALITPPQSRIERINKLKPARWAKEKKFIIHT